MSRGCFIAVVGPSGAGKDSLIREALAVRSDLMLARRVISRPLAPDSEDFESVGETEFQRRRSAGAFMLDWQAHGLSYGIPASIEANLEDGTTVLANLSRSMIAVARDRFDPFRTIVVTAPTTVLAKRLSLRGRETRADIAARLVRAGFETPSGLDVFMVDNGGRLEDGVAAFLAALPQPARG